MYFNIPSSDMLKCFPFPKRMHFLSAPVGLQGYRTLKRVELSVVQTYISWVEFHAHLPGTGQRCYTDKIE